MKNCFAEHLVENYHV